MVGKRAFGTHVGFCPFREVFKGAYLGRLVLHIWMGRGQDPEEKLSLRLHGVAE